MPESWKIVWWEFWELLLQSETCGFMEPAGQQGGSNEKKKNKLKLLTERNCKSTEVAFISCMNSISVTLKMRHMFLA